MADFLEMRCWIDGVKSANRGLSENEVVRHLTQADDNTTNSGCEDDEDALRDRVGEAMLEISRRSEACRDGYPFAQNDTGQILKVATRRRGRKQKQIYLYLLLCTRLNMDSNRNHADRDGTDLLEALSGHVLQTYLGPSAQFMIFGTSVSGAFQHQVDALCRQLGEGGSFARRGRPRVSAKDDGLDTVGWAPFADRRPGQLIVFGQCKTGTGWRDETAKLQPSNFVKKWMSSPLLVDPIRAFFVSESVEQAAWDDAVIGAGILFDRCRLVEHCTHLPSDTFTEISAWTKGAQQWVIENF